MKWTEFGGPGLMTAEEYVGKLEARLAELDASADIWEKRCMDSEVRLAAAERVVEAARELYAILPEDFQGVAGLADRLNTYEKAYSLNRRGGPTPPAPEGQK